MRKIKAAGIVCAAALVMLLWGLGGTEAFLQTHTRNVDNEFTPGSVSCTVEETFEGGVKENVRLRNTGNTDCYLRATVTVLWGDGAGNVLAITPEAGRDYAISFNSADWFIRDGIWYCPTSVAPDACTPVLVTQCTQIGQSPQAGYSLLVQITADAIQSSPARAAEEAWNVRIADGIVTG